MECKERVLPDQRKSLVIGDTIYGSAYDPLTAKDLQKANQELNEKEPEKTEYIKNLKERLKKDTEYNYCMDDEIFLSYLRFRKFDYDKAYNSIRNSQYWKAKYPELFRIPDDIEKFLNMGFITLLPHRDQEGRILLRFSFANWKTDEISINELLQTSLAWFELVLLTNPHCQINGTVSIWDFSGLSASHLSLILKPNIIWCISSMIQDCLPNRIKKGLFINCNAVFRMGFNCVKFVIKKKILERIKILGSDVSELHQYVNPALLPTTYGGPIDESECIITQHIMDNLPYLKYLRSFSSKDN